MDGQCWRCKGAYGLVYVKYTVARRCQDMERLESIWGVVTELVILTVVVAEAQKYVQEMCVVIFSRNVCAMNS